MDTSAKMAVTHMDRADHRDRNTPEARGLGLDEHPCMTLWWPPGSRMFAKSPGCSP